MDQVQQTIDIRMPDGGLFRGVPAGTPREEVMSRYLEMTKGGVPKPGMDMQQVDLATGAPADATSKLGAGVLKSGTGMVAGANKLGETLLSGKPSQSMPGLEEFSQPSSPEEAGGKLTGDILAMFAPGGASSRLARVLGQGAISGAEGGTPQDVALGAGAGAAGEAISAGVKYLRTSVRGIKDPQLKNLANAFRDSLSDIKPGPDARSGIEPRDIVRRSDIPGREPGNGDPLDQLRDRGRRSGTDVDRRGNFDRRQVSQPSSEAEQAVANVQAVWDATPQSVKQKPGASKIYSEVMNHLQAGRQDMPASLATKYDVLKDSMDRYAMHRAGIGGLMGGLYGERRGDPITGALEGAAAGASLSAIPRMLPAAGKAAPVLTTPLPPLTRQLFNSSPFGGPQQ